jgi:hypothetical protein
MKNGGLKWLAIALQLAFLLLFFYGCGTSSTPEKSEDTSEVSNLELSPEQRAKVNVEKFLDLCKEERYREAGTCWDPPLTELGVINYGGFQGVKTYETIGSDYPGNSFIKVYPEFIDSIMVKVKVTDADATYLYQTPVILNFLCNQENWKIVSCILTKGHQDPYPFDRQ